MIGYVVGRIYEIYKNSGIENGIKEVTNDFRELRRELNILSNNKHKRYYNNYINIDIILLNKEYINNEEEFRRLISKELEMIGTMDEILKIPLLMYEEKMENKMEKRIKKKIPAVIRRMVWDRYIGEEIGKSVCYSCKKMEISQMNFICGHVISEYEGGRTTVENLRPICNMCNLSMGTMNMDKFMDNYFY
jgi:hypothetical protein